MSRKSAIWLSLGGVVVVVLVAGLLLFQPWLLFIDDTVDEADDGGAIVGTASDGLSQTAFPSDQVADDDTGDGTGDDTGDGGRRVELVAAEFIDAEHATSGRAVIYLREDGSRYLRLEGFETSNGPDVHVWITDQASGGDCAGCSDSWGIYDDGDYVRLGSLKGNIGDQNYEIPADADLAAMRSVVIWCDRFNVAFGTAAIA